MKHIHTFEDFLNEGRKETGLTFTTRGPADATKMRNALDKSDLHYEWNAREGYFFFPEEVDNYDALELEIQKIADDNNVGGHVEGIWEAGSIKEGKTIGTLSDDDDALYVEAKELVINEFSKFLKTLEPKLKPIINKVSEKGRWVVKSNLKRGLENNFVDSYENFLK